MKELPVDHQTRVTLNFALKFSNGEVIDSNNQNDQFMQSQDKAFLASLHSKLAESLVYPKQDWLVPVLENQNVNGALGEAQLGAKLEKITSLYYQ